MTWGRGFFRAWLVLSVLWIGLAVYLSGPKNYSNLWRAVYEAKHTDGRVAQINLSKSRTEISADITAWMQSQRPDINIAELEKDRDKLLTLLIATYQSNIEKAKSAWLLTAIPPLALLGFGLSIFWVAQGFRRRS